MAADRPQWAVAMVVLTDRWIVLQATVVLIAALVAAVLVAHVLAAPIALALLWIGGKAAKKAATSVLQRRGRRNTGR